MPKALSAQPDRLRALPWIGPLLSGNSVLAQLVRYVVVGGSALVVDAGTFSLLRIVFDADLVSSNVAGRIVGACIAFLGHRLFTFQRNQVNRARFVTEALRYVLLLTFSMSLSTASLWLLTDFLFNVGPGLVETATKIVVECSIISLNFVAQRLWVFRKSAA
ncbi:GtrA family protein [Azospirillum sp. sgz301742]